MVNGFFISRISTFLILCSIDQVLQSCHHIAPNRSSPSSPPPPPPLIWVFGLGWLDRFVGCSGELTNYYSFSFRSMNLGGWWSGGGLFYANSVVVACSGGATYRSGCSQEHLSGNTLT